MASDSPQWTIEGQAEDYRPGPSGAFVAGVVITFRTADGVLGTVFVPNDSYTVEKVRELVAERARQMAAVSNLTG